MERNEAKMRRTRRAAGAAAVMMLAGVLTACAGADGPGDVAEAAEATETAPGAAPSEHCDQGVVVEPGASPETDDVFTAVTVARVTGDGIDVEHEWDRGEQPGATPASGASEAQGGMVEDAVAGGLLKIGSAPRLADAAEMLEGRSKGKYILYAYARHATRTATVSCVGGGDAVDATVVGFETLQTGVAGCGDSPDPVAEFAAAEAISTWCDRG